MWGENEDERLENAAQSARDGRILSESTSVEDLSSGDFLPCQETSSSYVITGRIFSESGDPHDGHVRRVQIELGC